jgi:hypothetical protein
MDDRDLPKLRACVVNIMAVLNTMKPGEAENCHGQWQVETDGRKLRGKRRTEFVLKWGK